MPVSYLVVGVGDAWQGGGREAALPELSFGSCLSWPGLRKKPSSDKLKVKREEHGHISSPQMPSDYIIVTVIGMI